MNLGYYLAAVVTAGLCAFAAGCIFAACWIAARTDRSSRPGPEDVTAEDLR